MHIIVHVMVFQMVASSMAFDRLWSRVQSITGTLFTDLLAVFFHIGTRALFHVHVQGLHNFSVSPSTIIAIDHKRDLDEIIIPSTLHCSKTLFRPRFRMWFAARDDVFDKGFLSSYFQLPRFLAYPLYAINLSPVMAAFRAQPIGRLSRGKVGSMLRDLYKSEGNVVLKDVLKKKWITKFASLLPPTLNSNLNNICLKDFLRYDYRVVHDQKSELSMLKSDVRDRTRSFQLNKIVSQLDRFSNILNEGGILFFTPEDDHSLDGRFGPVRSGLYRLIRMAQADLRILPVNIIYDFMTVGRMRIHITIGSEITNLKGLHKNEFESLLQIAITRLGVVNVGQLGSHCLLRAAQDNSEVITKELLARDILTQAQKLHNLGLSIDDVFVDYRAFEKRLDKFIKYCFRKHWLRDGGGGNLILNKEAVLDSSQNGYNAQPIRYSYIELMNHKCAYTMEEPRSDC